MSHHMVTWVMLITEIGCSSSKIGLFVAVLVLSGMLHKRHEITNAVELLHEVLIHRPRHKIKLYYKITQITHLKNTQTYCIVTCEYMDIEN